MKKTLKLFITFIIIGITQVSCVKEDLKCPDEVPFCQLISQGEFNQTGDIFNSYFSKQNKNLSDLEKLKQLSDWLECKT